MRTHTVTSVLLSVLLFTIILSGQQSVAARHHDHEDSPLFKVSLERSVEKMDLSDKKQASQGKPAKVYNNIAVVDHGKQLAYVLPLAEYGGVTQSAADVPSSLEAAITPQFATISSCVTMDYSCYVTTCSDTITCGTTCGSTCVGLPTCDSTCAGQPTCYGTCTGFPTCDYTCGTTCDGATCGTTCNTTCNGATCGTTCDGATCHVGSCLEIREIVLETNRNVSICVVSSPGTVCVLECTTNLESAVWEYVSEEACLGSEVWLQHSNALDNVLFYHVVVRSYLENFDDGLAQDWVAEVDANWQVVSGEYRAQSSINGTMATAYGGREWTNVTAQVSCRRVGADNTAAGLILRQTIHSPESVSGYTFRIAENGSYGVWKYVESSSTELQGWTTSSAIQTGTNILMATASGSSLQFFINGTLVWSGTDTSLTSGQIGLLGYSDDTYTSTHYFDNVTAGDPVLY